MLKAEIILFNDILQENILPEPKIQFYKLKIYDFKSEDKLVTILQGKIICNDNYKTTNT